ncbi:MAG: inositol phosphorylceramide synthase [Labilithrix sp.]|nr:inositol phosphorylceramide synthase [Labilithrix sp.]MCW5812376.1 inositol phosphorylceramide synthase [Labilithrix sp.]
MTSPVVRRTALLLAPFAVYAVYCAARRDLRVEHLAPFVVIVGLSAIGPRARELVGALMPFALVGTVFDAMRPFQKVGLSEARVLLCDLRAVESRLFGWGSGGERFTVHDWFREHHHPALDVLCAVPYGTFIMWCAALNVYLYVKDRPAMRRFGWAFLLMNLAAFATYHALPAAPPWYFHAHGCAVDLATRASEGPVLARVDALLGVHYFHGMYSKASSVFGALPSLHCAYPLLIAIVGWRAFGRGLRVAVVAYYLLMVFSAIYLDHHWLLDALLGSAFAVGAAWAVGKAVPRDARAAGPAAEPETA